MQKNTLLNVNQQGNELLFLIEKHAFLKKSRTVKSYYYMNDNYTLNIFRKTELWFYEKKWYVVTETWNNSKTNCFTEKEMSNNRVINIYETKKQAQTRERKMISIFKKAHPNMETIFQIGE